MGDGLTDVREVVDFHKDRGALATIALARVTGTSQYGVVELDPEGNIVKLTSRRSRDPARPQAIWRTRASTCSSLRYSSTDPDRAAIAGQVTVLRGDLLPPRASLGVFCQDALPLPVVGVQHLIQYVGSFL
jgi:ADP-glucose pyrophosphorylase